MSDEGEFLEILATQMSRVRTPAARRENEMKSVHPADRLSLIRKMAPEDVRNQQFNLRISARFKQHLTALAIEEGISITEIIVKVVYHYKARDKK